MACLYADEQFPREVSDRLRMLGHDVLTVQAAGNANLGIPDENVFLPSLKIVQLSPSIARILSPVPSPTSTNSAKSRLRIVGYITSTS